MRATPSLERTIQIEQAIAKHGGISGAVLQGGFGYREVQHVWHRMEEIQNGPEVRPHTEGRAPRKRCGTYAGYQRHRRNKEKACELCSAASNSYNRHRKELYEAAKRERLRAA